MRAPFSPQQVKRINAYQLAGVFHELTCPKPHKNRALIAHEQGLFCPSCDYVQEHCPDFVDNPRWERRVNLFTGEDRSGDAAE